LKFDGANGAQCDWVDEVMLGDWLVEVQLHSTSLISGENLPDEYCNRSNRSTFRTPHLTADKLVPVSAEREAVLKAYSIVKGTPIEKFVEQATFFSRDLIFQQAIHDSACEFVKAGKKTFYYHWDCPNPLPAPFFSGVAHHFVDVLFLFQTLHEIYPNDLARKIAEDMGR
jgi:hypothetical protein